jgi:UDP-N-acetylglucosamine acyltransferase
VALRVNEICGLNSVGLRRAGFIAEQRMELKQLYHLLFRSGENLRPALAEAQKKFTSPAAKTLLDFVAGAKRGVCADSGNGSGVL